jgi:hypothetical protein
VRALNFIVMKAPESAGINPAVSIHWLRHAQCVARPRQWGAITLVSATLGRADLKTSVYAHARPGESRGRYLKTKFSSLIGLTTALTNFMDWPIAHLLLKTPAILALAKSALDSRI